MIEPHPAAAGRAVDQQDLDVGVFVPREDDIGVEGNGFDDSVTGHRGDCGDPLWRLLTVKLNPRPGPRIDEVIRRIHEQRNRFELVGHLHDEINDLGGVEFPWRAGCEDQANRVRAGSGAGFEVGGGPHAADLDQRERGGQEKILVSVHASFISAFKASRRAIPSGESGRSSSASR